MNVCLNGLRVVNTRPSGQAQALTMAIKKAGGVSIELPLLDIQAKSSWQRGLPALSDIQQAIFVSANAVTYFFKDLGLSWPQKIRIIAVGKATAKALETFHLKADELPSQADSEHLLALDSLSKPYQRGILLIKGEEGRTLIQDSLSQRGAHLHVLEVYQRTLVQPDKQLLVSLWQDNAFDIMLFTSEQAIKHFVSLVPQIEKHRILNKPCTVISQRLANTAAELNLTQVIVSSYDNLISTFGRFAHDSGIKDASQTHIP